MNCDAARLQIGAEPFGTSAPLEEHLEGCASCAGFREETRVLEAAIRRALADPPNVAGRRRLRQGPVWREWALAASVLLVAVAMLGVWLLRPSDTLAHDVVVHVQHEPGSWLATHVSSADIAAALRAAGVQLELSSDRITYAHSCWFRGHYVPHLVVQTAQGPTTVMILAHEHVVAARSFHEGGMTGVIVPSGAGSIAVLSRGTGSVAAVAGRMQQDVRWLTPSH